MQTQADICQQIYYNDLKLQVIRLRAYADTGP